MICYFLTIIYLPDLNFQTDGMSVTVQYADGEPLSASVPQRVTCKVVDAEPSYKGQTATPMLVYS